MTSRGGTGTAARDDPQPGSNRARWIERRMAPVRFDLDTWDRHAPLILAHLSDGTAPMPTIRGPNWRAIRIGRQTVFWHVPSAGWEIHAPPYPLAGMGITELWMLVHDCDRVQAVCDIANLVAGL